MRCGGGGAACAAERRHGTQARRVESDQIRARIGKKGRTSMTRVEGSATDPAYSRPRWLHALVLSCYVAITHGSPARVQAGSCRKRVWAETHINLAGLEVAVLLVAQARGDAVAVGVVMVAEDVVNLACSPIHGQRRKKDQGYGRVV
jgi:hypothetical protein